MGRRASAFWRADRVHMALGLGLALLLTLAGFALFRPGYTATHFLAAWLVSINLTALAYYGYDKALARSGKRRVPEVVLHGLALAGGSLGAWLAMRLFRHKTLKGNFRLAFWCIVALQLTICAWVASRLWGRTP